MRLGITDKERCWYVVLPVSLSISVAALRASWVQILSILDPSAQFNGVVTTRMVSLAGRDSESCRSMRLRAA